MLLNSLLFIFLILFSVGLFFINNIYIVISLLIISLLLSLIFKVHLPIFWPFIIILLINFLFNYLLSGIIDAIIVTIRLIIMFITVNLIIKKIGVFNLSKVIGLIFHSKTIELMVAITLSFIPFLSKEIKNIRASLKTKNFSLNLKNIITRPHIFVITFFNNLFQRVSEMENVFISRGIDE